MKKITTKKPFVVTCLSFASNLLRYQEREREREREMSHGRIIFVMKHSYKKDYICKWNGF